ncbi:hypothetical protein QAD02_006188 [Eretmocerus hayati]|uniref:Uncharacterized protein n=1 Tax=Eretmocerus hayati TaxID=131215 RepID=A0ACC2N1D0_9HYME|nr:hypothetical protein QAD02_006188 [Eretmocerus hayati]
MRIIHLCFLLFGAFVTYSHANPLPDTTGSNLEDRTNERIAQAEATIDKKTKSVDERVKSQTNQLKKRVLISDELISGIITVLGNVHDICYDQRAFNVIKSTFLDKGLTSTWNKIVHTTIPGRNVDKKKSVTDVVSKNILEHSECFYDPARREYVEKIYSMDLKKSGPQSGDKATLRVLANNLNQTRNDPKLKDQGIITGALLSNNAIKKTNDIDQDWTQDYQNHKMLDKLITIEQELKTREDELKSQERTISVALKEVDFKKQKLMEKQMELNSMKKEIETWELRWEIHLEEVTRESQLKKQKLDAKKREAKIRQHKIKIRIHRLENLIQKSKNRQKELASDMQKLQAELVNTHKKFEAAIHQALENVCDSDKNMKLVGKTLKSKCKICESFRSSHIQSSNGKTIEDIMRDDKVLHTEYVYDDDKGVTTKSGYILDLNDPNPHCQHFGPETFQIKTRKNAPVISDSFV